MGGALGAVSAQMSTFMDAAEEIKKAARQFEGVEALSRQIDAAREVAAKALEEFAGFEYELTKQRFVSLRLQHFLMWGVYDTSSTKTLDERAQELLELELTFRAEYDAIQALILLVTKEA